MDEYQLEKAFETLRKLRRLDFLSKRTADLIDIIEQKLDLCQILFANDDDTDGGEAVESELPWFSWRAAVEAIQRLIVQAEEETQSLPGCLPVDQKGCELMSLTFSLRRAVMEGCEFYGLRLKKKSGGV